MTGLAKVESLTRVCGVSILGWARASQTQALENARIAAVECSRRRVERAEVAQAVAELEASYAAGGIALSTGHASARTAAR
jgi:hypothetical protein